MEKIRFFKGDIKSKSKLNVIVGHATSQANMTFFVDTDVQDARGLREAVSSFSLEKRYLYSERLCKSLELGEKKILGWNTKSGDSISEGTSDSLDNASELCGSQYCLLEFDQPIVCSLDSALIGVKLDTDVHSNSCRIGFHGRIVQTLVQMSPSDLHQLQIYKKKSREGVIERLQDERTAICRGMFKKETDLSIFVGLKITAENGATGTIEGAFGKSGKFKAYFPSALQSDPVIVAGSKVRLEFHRYIFDKEKSICQ